VSDAFVIEIGRQTLEVTLLVAAPMLLASLVVGLLVSLFQVATSIQDGTLTFVPKIVATAAAALIAGGWMLHKLVDFTRHVFELVPKVTG
jgi:flagellar biosynthetic protein FliQ